MILLLLSTILLAGGVVGFGHGRRSFLLALPAPVAILVWAAIQTPAVVDGDLPAERVSWVPALGLTFDLRLTAMGLVMTWLIAAVGVLVLVYAWSYFDEERPDLGRFTAVLLVFAGAMCGLVWSDNLLALFVFWELTSVASYLLIGFEDRRESARNAALQALLITGAGGLCLLFGIVLVGESAGTYTISGLAADPPTGAAVTAGAVLVLLGAFTKSAQVPFHGWLPGAMAAPTPVSAYLHSATMVKAGVYLIAVLGPALSAVGPWRPLTVGFGAVTMVFGGYQSLRGRDLKSVLAYSTVGALGLLVALFGLADAKTTFAAVAVLVAHALYKACLFMVVGIVDHTAHSRDLSRLPALRTVMPGVAVAAALAGASLAGLPATLGFVAKEGALEGLLGSDVGGSVVVLGALGCFSALSVAAVWRFWTGAFTDVTIPLPPGETAGEPISATGLHRPSVWFVGPAVVLATAGVVLGVMPSLIDPLVGAAAASIDPGAADYHLHAFAGFNAALAASVAMVGAGAVLVVLARPVAALQARTATGVRAGVAFRGVVAALLRLANRVAGTVQSGSLPRYLTVILATLVLLPGVVLAGSVSLPSGWVWSETALQAAAALAVMVSGIGVVVTSRRFAAVLLLGAVGYSMAVLFVAYDAPDLALTQFLVETVVVVAFVAVLRRLPDTFPHVPWRSREVARIGVSIGVGLLVFAFLLSTGGPGLDPPSSELVDVAGPVGGGANVVNVILTDIRALDTLGEITVLAVAALGVLSLGVFAGRRERVMAEGAADDRSTVLDTAVALTLPLVFTLSLFLLVSGHNAPGGGFIAGLVASAGLVLRTVAQPGGPPYRWERVELLVGGGLLLAVAVAMSGWLAGDTFFDLRVATWGLPVVGDVKVTGALPFDIGVYLVVVGTMVAILQGLGRNQIPGGGPMILVLALATAVLFSTGTYLLLQRRLTRVILGASLLGHGSVLALLVAGGRTGEPAIVEPGRIESGIAEGANPAVSDPLVQALALTAIVITFAVTVFLLALANRRWELTGDDRVEDDLEDRRIDALVGDEQLETQFEPQPDEPELLP